MAFLAKGRPQRCPMEGCTGRVVTRTEIQVHFMHWHVLDTVVILEEVNIHHPRCPRCIMLFPCHTLNRSHPATVQCAIGAERTIRRLAEEELRGISERAFEAYGTPLENVTAFKCRGRMMTAVNDDWLSVVGSLHKARKSWGQFCRFCSGRGRIRRCRDIFKAATQAMLLFGAETWVITPRMERDLSSF